MDVFDAIYARRAVKHFDPHHEMTQAEVDRLLEAAIQAPTSFNIQHWRFVVVRDPELRRQIRANGNDQAQMTDASLLVLMTADVQAWRKQPERYWANAPKEVADEDRAVLPAARGVRSVPRRDPAAAACAFTPPSTTAPS